MISSYRYYNISWYSFAISLNYCFVLEHYISIIFVTYCGSVLDPSFWFLSMIMYKCLSELYVKGMCLCCILIHTPPQFIPLPPTLHIKKLLKLQGSENRKSILIHSFMFIDMILMQAWQNFKMLIFFLLFYKAYLHSKKHKC